MHPFFREVLKDWNLAPCQITPNGWGQMVASYLLWVVAEAGGNLTSREFESIYRPYQSSSWYNVSLRPGQKWRTAMDSPNKVHNWKERFFFVGGDWKFIPEDLLPHVSIPRRFGKLDCGKPPIPKRNQGELRSKWDKVRALSSEFRSLNNLLKDDNLLLSGSKRYPYFVSPAPPARRVLRHKLLSKRRWVHCKRPRTSCHQVSFLLYVPRSTLMSPPVCLRPPTFTLTPLLRGTKGKRLLREVKRRLLRRGRPPQPRRGLCAMLIRRGGQRKANRRIRISERCEELPASVMGMLPAHPSIVAASVHRYWTSRWEKVADEATILERLQLAEVNLVRGLVLAKDIFSAFASFDAEDSKSKKLVEDLKVMGLEKAQLESDKRALKFKLDLVVSKEADMKAKYEIELKAAKECLKQVRDQKRVVEASQKRTEEAQKLAKDWTLVAETVLAVANTNLEAAAADNERSLSAMRLELEKIKAERADAEARPWRHIRMLLWTHPSTRTSRSA
ncbi:Plus3 domain-containing protein [Abeliophyllum distichum]|uniref:Plus3 domain-containing protein n=1 Tax=Abeliophyllum distichum TaxID=126358 RepID=A0ABD1QFY4_9LAMI